MSRTIRGLEWMTHLNDVAHYKRFGMDDSSLSSKTDGVTDGEDEPDDADAETISALNIVRFLLMNSPDGELSSREIGRALQGTEIDGENNNEVSNLLTFVKAKYGNLKQFLSEYEQEFSLTFYSNDELSKGGKRASEYMVSFAATDDAEDEFVETAIVKQIKTLDLEDIIESSPEDIADSAPEEVTEVVAEKTRRRKTPSLDAEEGEEKAKPSRRVSRSKKAA
jgi:hypothetical protein